MEYNNLSQNIIGRLVYIRSTDIEQGNWHRLLWSVPDEWLYLMSKGEPIFLTDKTSNSNGGKVKKIFCPVLIDVLNFLFLGIQPVSNCFKWHYQKAMSALNEDKSLKRRFLFWKKKIISPVSVIGKSVIVAKEPNPLESKFSPSVL